MFKITFFVQQSVNAKPCGNSFSIVSQRIWSRLIILWFLFDKLLKNKLIYKINIFFTANQKVMELFCHFLLQSKEGDATNGSFVVETGPCPVF